MTLTQLEYVVAVATYRSFVAAAEKCFVTQPTLSMQIQKLEESMNVKIFDRQKHPIEITSIGEAIVNQAKIVLAEAEKIHDIIQSRQQNIVGIFKIAIIPTLAPYIIPGLVEQYVHKYPKVRLEVTEMETNQMIAAIRNNEIDAGLASTPLEENDLKEYPLFYEPFVGYFHPDEPAMKKRLITPADIDFSKMWLLNEGHCMRNQIINLCSDHIKKEQINKPFSYASSNVETLRKMVDKNKGLTILPELATLEFDDEQLEQIRYFENPEPVREVGLVTNGHFVKMAMLQSLIEEVPQLVPKKMRIQTSNRKILRIQSAKL